MSQRFWKKNNVTEILKRARKIQSLGKVRNFQNFLYDHYNAQKPIFKKKVKIALLVKGLYSFQKCGWTCVHLND